MQKEEHCVFQVLRDEKHEYPSESCVIWVPTLMERHMN
jgi:hypothetical protein